MQPLQKQRPVYLNLFQFRFPATAILSILHRISGVILVLAFPVLVYLFGVSLQSEQDFSDVRSMLASGPLHWFVLLLLWSISHHLFAGIRYFLIDFECLVTRNAAGRSAWTVIVLAILLTVWLYWKVLI